VKDYVVKNKSAATPDPLTAKPAPIPGYAAPLNRSRPAPAPQAADDFDDPLPF
jgi:hypothetical protein